MRSFRQNHAAFRLAGHFGDLGDYHRACADSLGQTEFELRGLSSSGGAAPTVGFYLDETPLTAAAFTQNGKVVIDPNLYDISRVEVLRGPQGTLYGSGSMGGTIKLVTNQPNLDKLEASADGMISQTDNSNGINHNENAMINVPVVPGVLAVRLVGSLSYADGWINRVVVGNPNNATDWLPTNNGDTRWNVLSEKPTQASTTVNSYGTFADYLTLPSYALTDLRFALQGDKWTASLFVNNLTDKHAELGTLNINSFNLNSYSRIVTNQPRTVGLDISVKY